MSTPKKKTRNLKRFLCWSLPILALLILLCSGSIGRFWLFFVGPILILKLVIELCRYIDRPYRTWALGVKIIAGTAIGWYLSLYLCFSIYSVQIQLGLKDRQDIIMTAFFYGLVIGSAFVLLLESYWKKSDHSSNTNEVSSADKLTQTPQETTSSTES